MRLATQFRRFIGGYHCVSDEPIKEAVWEAINRDILAAAGVAVTRTASGSHQSGADIHCALGALSNKTCIRNPSGGFNMSSYRLTTVCSDANPGTAAAVCEEINRRKNFQHYSILLRSEPAAGHMEYAWYLVPADFPALNPVTYTWGPKVGKQGKKKGSVVGWTTEERDGSSMDVTFSMSSQLWIRVAGTPELEAYRVAGTTVALGRTMDYGAIFDSTSTGTSSA